MSNDSETTLPLRLEWRTPEELADNPANWRLHPSEQTSGLDGLLTEVGWAGAALYNERTGRLIDGHLRKAVDPAHLVDGRMPVLVGSWTEEQEKKILAALDPIAGLAKMDEKALSLLLADIHTDVDNLQHVFDRIMPENTLNVDYLSETAGFAEGEQFSDSPLLIAIPITAEQANDEAIKSDLTAFCQSHGLEYKIRS